MREGRKEGSRLPSRFSPIQTLSGEAAGPRCPFKRRRGAACRLPLSAPFPRPGRELTDQSPGWRREGGECEPCGRAVGRGPRPPSGGSPCAGAEAAAAGGAGQPQRETLRQAREGDWGKSGQREAVSGDPSYGAALVASGPPGGTGSNARTPAASPLGSVGGWGSPAALVLKGRGKEGAADLAPPLGLLRRGRGVRALRGRDRRLGTRQCPPSGGRCPRGAGLPSEEPRRPWLLHVWLLDAEEAAAAAAQRQQRRMLGAAAAAAAATLLVGRAS